MKDAALLPSQVLISAAVDQTLAPVLILAADQTVAVGARTWAPVRNVAAVARTCAPVRNVAAARSAALVPTLVAVRTCAPAVHNEEFPFAPVVAA